MIPETVTSFIDGAVVAGSAVGLWAILRIDHWRSVAETLAAARDHNVQAFIDERTKRLDAEARLDVVRQAWSRGGRNAAQGQRVRAAQRRSADRSAVIQTANKIRAGLGMDQIEISPADEAAPKQGGSVGNGRSPRGKRGGSS